MNSLEAMTRLTVLAQHQLDEAKKKWTEQTGEEASSYPDEGETGVAIAVITAMLNTALPIARFRVFVEVDKLQPPSKKERPVGAEFTGCATTIHGIRSSIQGLSVEPTNVRVLLFEQRATGAEMISAYQGKTRTTNYRNWLKGLDLFNSTETVQ